MSQTTQKPSAAPLETGAGGQKDDNIDDLGHRPDGSEQDQPVDGDKGSKPGKPGAKPQSK